MKTLGLILLLTMVPLFLEGCGDSGNTPLLIAGIQGQVYSIASPGPTPGGWVPPPLEMVSTILILDSNHKLFLQTISDNKGRFSAQLDPGTYYLRVKESMIPAETGPYVVKAGAVVPVRAHYDNGMR